MSDDRKDLPPASAPNFNERLRETLQTYLGTRGNKLDRGVTLRDLVEGGFARLRPGFLAGSGAGGNPLGGPGSAISAPYEIDLTPPPTPTGFSVSAAISNVFIEHAAPIYSQGHGHAKTVVYGATWTGGTLPVFGDAVKITEFSGTVFAHPTNPATVWHLWIKWVSADGVESAAPAGGTNGLVAETGQDVTKLVEAMTGPGNPFTVLAVDTVVDGVTFPAGTYSTKAFIIDAQITSAKIKNLAVDNAKIADLSVSKLTAGSLAVGQYAQSTSYVAGVSGWRINGDGTAEFSGVVVRGTLYATAGLIGGNAIDSMGLESPDYVPDVTGWRLDSNGALYAKTGVFSGSLSGASITGATGTFSGLVSGGSLNINGRATISSLGEAYFDDIVISRPNMVASGTWTGSVDALAGGVVQVDTGYDDFSTISNVNSAVFNANAIFTNGYLTYSGAGPGETKVGDVSCSIVVSRGITYYIAGVLTPGSGRVILSIHVNPATNVHASAITWSCTEIKWALLRVT